MAANLSLAAKNPNKELVKFVGVCGWWFVVCDWRDKGKHFPFVNSPLLEKVRT